MRLSKFAYFNAGVFATQLTLAVWANLRAQPREPAPSPVTASKPGMWHPPRPLPVSQWRRQRPGATLTRSIPESPCRDRRSASAGH